MQLVGFVTHVSSWGHHRRPGAPVYWDRLREDAWRRACGKMEVSACSLRIHLLQPIQSAITRPRDLVSQGRSNRIQTTWSHCQTHIILSWKLEDQDQGASCFAPAEDSLRVDSHLLFVSSCDRQERTLVSLPLFRRAPAQLNEGPPPITLLNLSHLLTGPISNTVTLGIRVSTYEFEEETQTFSP